MFVRAAGWGLAAGGAAGATALNAVTYLDVAGRGRPASSTPEQTVKKLSQVRHLPIPGDEDTRGNPDQRARAADRDPCVSIRVSSSRWPADGMEATAARGDQPRVRRGAGRVRRPDDGVGRDRPAELVAGSLGGRRRRAPRLRGSAGRGAARLMP